MFLSADRITAQLHALDLLREGSREVIPLAGLGSDPPVVEAPTQPASALDVGATDDLRPAAA